MITYFEMNTFHRTEPKISELKKTANIVIIYRKYICQLSKKS